MNQSAQRKPRVAVVGAGVSGIAVGRAMRKAGVPFTIFEKASEAGGTWRDNTYPGLKCDVPLFAYCFSFAPGTGGWERLLAPGAEIQQRLLGILEHEQLREHVCFGAEIVDCRWDVDRWRLRTAAGEEHEAEVVVHATGWLHRPNFPVIEGLESFAGEVVHTARWDPSVVVDGKRVGVVGSGSTGTQVVSALAGRAAHVTSFQRTPQWVLPVSDNILPKRFVAALTRFPRFANFVRGRFWSINGGFVGSAATRNGWQRRIFGNIVRKHLATIEDPDLRARLTPSYPPLCKRPVMSTDFYEVVQRPDVSVVRGPLGRVEPAGVVSDDGTLHELDVLVLATGYDAHAYMRPMRIEGRDGQTLDELWSKGPVSYRSIGLPGFPNMFMIMGPYVSTSHIGVQEQAEAQAGYIVKAIERLSQPETVSLTPRKDATDAWLQSVRDALPPTVWMNCNSYYVAENGPVQWPWSRKEFLKMLETVDLSEYDVRSVGDRPAAMAGEVAL
jgi:cation diffusion facilitator CzcD-associated flavoprotein CzcO